MHTGYCLSLVATLFSTAAVAAVAPDPPGYIAFVVAGTPDSNLPAFNAVAGATGNVAIANPKSVLTIGQVYAYAVWSRDQTVTGKCVTSYTLSQTISGVKTVLDTAVIKRYNCSPGTVWLWVTNGKAIPNSPGPAVLTGTVKFGTSVAKFNVPVLLQ